MAFSDFSPHNGPHSFTGSRRFQATRIRSANVVTMAEEEEKIAMTISISNKDLENTDKGDKMYGPHPHFSHLNITNKKKHPKNKKGETFFQRRRKRKRKRKRNIRVGMEWRR